MEGKGEVSWKNKNNYARNNSMHVIIIMGQAKTVHLCFIDVFLLFISIHKERGDQILAIVLCT